MRRLTQEYFTVVCITRHTVLPRRNWCNYFQRAWVMENIKHSGMDMCESMHTEKDGRIMLVNLFLSVSRLSFNASVPINGSRPGLCAIACRLTGTGVGIASDKQTITTFSATPRCLSRRGEQLLTPSLCRSVQPPLRLHM